MTIRQKIHYLWLVLMNAERMAERCQNHWQASRLITRATDRRAALGLPLHRIGDGQKRRQCVATLARTFSPMRSAPWMRDDDYVEEPY